MQVVKTAKHIKHPSMNKAPGMQNAIKELRAAMICFA